MPAILVAALSGIVFGLGLMISGMARPDVVLGFLDPLGAWNPALAFVMIGAIPTAAIAFATTRKLRRPVLQPRFHLPTRKDIDARLLIGSALFGVGWGLAGICPAPALTLLPRAPAEALVFVVPMVIGLVIGARIRALNLGSSPGHARVGSLSGP